MSKILLQGTHYSLKHGTSEGFADKFNWFGESHFEKWMQRYLPNFVLSGKYQAKRNIGIDAGSLISEMAPTISFFLEKCFLKLQVQLKRSFQLSTFQNRNQNRIWNLRKKEKTIINKLKRIWQLTERSDSQKYHGNLSNYLKYESRCLKKLKEYEVYSRFLGIK